MNPFLSSPAQLSACWKSVRIDLHEKPELDQLQAVVDFWCKAPLATMAYDPEALDTYPTAWEMISANDWCANSVAVGMEFTLRLSGWSTDRLRIQMIRDYDLSDQRLVVVVDGKYYLNYEYGSVIEEPNTKHDVLDTWAFVGKHYSKV